MVCEHVYMNITPPPPPIIVEMIQESKEIKTNFYFDTDTSLRHYHHNNHNDHYTNYIDLYIDHFYSGTANNSNIALLMWLSRILL